MDSGGRVSFSQLADGPSDHEFRGQDTLTEGHSRMMQPLEKHLHAGFADLFFMNAHGGKRRGPQNRFFPGVGTHPSGILTHVSLVAPSARPKPRPHFLAS